MISVTIEQIIDIHSESIKIFGGMPGIKNKELLESTLMSAEQGYYSDDIEIIGAIVYGICQNYPFNDGNKRTAFIVGK
jgi:death-on-curing protein